VPIAVHPVRHRRQAEQQGDHRCHVQEDAAQTLHIGILPPWSRPSPAARLAPALIWCEHIAVDAQKGRIDIYNVVNAILRETIPGEIRFAVHFSLTEGEGDYELELALEHDEQGAAAIWKGKCSLRTPMVVHEQPIFVNLKMGLIGQCWVKLYANGE
jgi:hypothetical protein